MSDKSKARSVDPASQAMLKRTEEQGMETAWDRWDAMQPQCGFGQLGVCCRICSMGPCRINPFSEEEQCGVCGASADTIAARNLVRMIAAGSAAHSDHGRDVCHTMLMAAEDDNADYAIKDDQKLMTLAKEFGIPTEGKEVKEIAKAVAEKAFAQFGQQHGELLFLARAPEARQEIWRKQGVAPRGVDREVVELMHITHMGVDNDYKDVIKYGIKAALADGWGGSMIATELQDILFGSPKPVRAKVNLGCLEKQQVNIVVHGHEPVLSDMIVHATQDPELLALAKKRGAEGINLAGICCTANEILMRHGVPVAGNFLQQELALATGAVDAMVVDVQCVMPGLSRLADCFHTRLVTTSPKAVFPDENVTHIEFHEEAALKSAKEIVRLAIENYGNRNPEAVDIPDIKEDLIAGFTTENTFRFLGGRYRATYRPLNNAIIEGRIRGLAGVIGCCNPNMRHDEASLAMVEELIKNDVLVVQTGCSALACAKKGLLRPEGAALAGPGLQEVCAAVGIPPVLHLGACVDNSRILVALCNVQAEGGLGDDLSDLPAAGAAPEWMSEKAIAIGFYVAASGVLTVLGEPMPMMGGKKLAEYVCGGMAEDFGGYFAFEKDGVAAARLMIEHINKKRAALKLRPMLSEKMATAAAS